VTVLWISDPDTTAHEHGVGHPTTIDALKRIARTSSRSGQGVREYQISLAAPSA